jgi:hypothetical protein
MSDVRTQTQPDREHERNRGVAVQLWKREGIILPGFAGAIARWRRQRRKRTRRTEEDNR